MPGSSRNPPPSLLRVLAPLVSGVWIFFWTCTLVLAAVWVFGLDHADLQRAVSNRWLRSVLLPGSAFLDAAWVTLAAVNVYLGTAAAEGVATARRWALLALLSFWLVACASTATDWPLGSVEYTERLGTRIGPVPFGFPLLWFAIAVGARSVVVRLFPAISHWQIALAAGFLIVLTDLNLEPIAWKERGFWIWQASEPAASTWPPPRNYISWFVLGTALVYALRPAHVAPHPTASSWRPGMTFVVLNLVLLATHLGRWWRAGQENGLPVYLK